MYNLLNPERHSTTDLLYLKEKEKKKSWKKNLKAGSYSGWME